MNEYLFHIQAMSCGSCVGRIGLIIRGLDDTAKLDAVVAKRQVRIITALSAAEIQTALAGQNYLAELRA